MPVSKGSSILAGSEGLAATSIGAARTFDRGKVGNVDARSQAAPPATSIDDRWARIGRNAGYVAGVGFIVGTVLYLLDALDWLGESPSYHVTNAGRLQDEANFWVAVFAHQRDIVWDIIARDTILPLALVALIVLGLAIRHLAGSERPDGHLMVTFLAVGGIFAIVADLTYLGAAEFWRIRGWMANPPEIMVAVGRVTEGINSLTRWPEAAGFAILALGALYLARLCRTSEALPRWAAPVAAVTAALLLVIAISSVARWDTAYEILSLALGVVLAPVLTIGLGRHLGSLGGPLPALEGG